MNRIMNRITQMNSVVIDNCIVSNMYGGITILPISMAIKRNPELRIESLQKITYGNRQKDQHMISKLSSGLINYAELF